MSTGHTHTDAHGCDATHQLLCELFDEETLSLIHISEPTRPY